MTAAASAHAHALPPPPIAAPAASRPLVGVAAVLAGAIISTLYGRVTSFGLADIRGAIGAGFDEGAWITTAATVGQMFMGVLSVWLSAAYGVRRVLLAGTAVFAFACLLIPLAPGIRSLVGLQFVAGLGSGVYVPVAIGFVLRSLHPPYQVFGIAAYAMSLELSQNVPASLEGFYVDVLSWRWIFWQHLLLAPVMLVLTWFGVPREPVNRAVIAGFDAPGVLFLGTGASLLYAALDQGDRLDWLGSGLVVGLLAGGGLLLALFVIRELIADQPFFDLRYTFRSVLPQLALVLTLYRAVVLATATIVPQYLTQVQGLRALQVGDALVLIALPQILLAPLVGLTLQRIDARYVMAIGFALIGGACLIVATGLTRDWASGDFAPSQLVQAAGQCCALTGFLWFATRHIDMKQLLTFGAFIQTFRLFGGEIGIGFMTWFLRAREQTHSLLLGEHVQAGALATQARLAGLAAGLAGRSAGPATAQGRAAALLGNAVRTQSFVLTYIDAMTLLALVAAAALVVTALLGPAPAPGRPQP